MSTKMTLAIAASVALISVGSIAHAETQQSMTFFLTSTGLGNGGDLGGVDSADRHCTELAQAVGAGAKTWRAYLSTQFGDAPVNARDRIGAGPWQNANGEVIAQSVDDLHSANNKIKKETALTERGQMVNGRDDTPSRHDILTGSQSDGRAFAAAGDDRTCGNWTKSGAGAAMLGHHDRRGLGDDAVSKSWNSSHPSRGTDGGCSQADLGSTGGEGLFYCFAID